MSVKKTIIQKACMGTLLVCHEVARRSVSVISGREQV